MRVGGARPPPLITFTLTSKVAVYAPAEAHTLTLFHLYQYMYSVVSANEYSCTQEPKYVNFEDLTPFLSSDADPGASLVRCFRLFDDGEIRTRSEMNSLSGSCNNERHYLNFLFFIFFQFRSSLVAFIGN